MDILYWDDVIRYTQPAFSQGAALSIGGFDGPHRGHERIFHAVLQAASRYGAPAGLITFRRSPRFQKAGTAYSGDVSTLEMRLRKFESYGFVFTVLIDFSEDFAKIRGTVFFDILMKTIRIKYLAVGSDFTCGYRHDTGSETLRLLASTKGFCFDSIEQLCSGRYGRISSSAIRQAVEQADFTLAKDLLGYPFFLDVSKIAQRPAAEKCFIDTSSIEQILPMNGWYTAQVYSCAEEMSLAHIRITDSVLEVSSQGVPALCAAGNRIQTIQFIRKE